MSDVYIVYAHENRKTAEKVFTLLSQQWAVWWDDNIVGDFGRAISSNIPKTKCIVALFSEHSHKNTVTDELRIGDTYKKHIIPLILDNSEAPYPYGRLSSIDFREWNEQADHPKFKQLQHKLGLVVPPPQAPRRLLSIKNMKLPQVFMSISSFETRFEPAEALQLLKIHNTNALLVSAYDVMRSSDKRKIIKSINEHKKNGGIVLLDSGNYEADRLDDKTWKAAEFREALKIVPHDWAFCFDRMKPGIDPNKNIEKIIKTVKQDQKHTSSPILPIVHIKQNEDGLKVLPSIMRKIAEQLKPPIIAVPERELGPGIAARVKTMRRIRKELDELSFYQPVHLLGTGNPRGIALLVSAGADSFDGLEWCRFAVNHKNGSLDHFQHLDLIKAEADRTPFLDVVDADEEIGYPGKVALYNLEYYAEFGNMMRSMIATGDHKSHAVGVVNLPLTKLRHMFPEIFE